MFSFGGDFDIGHCRCLEWIEKMWPSDYFISTLQLWLLMLHINPSIHLCPPLLWWNKPFFITFIAWLVFKAITYLQSAQRLKGEDVVEADDISEIAGVRSIISQLQLQYYFYEIKGLAKLHVFNVTWNKKYIQWLIGIKKIINTYHLVTFLQVVPSKMADKLFEACGSDSFEKLDATVQVRD